MPTARPHAGPVVAAVSAGGALGALARHAIATAWPHRPDAFPWATWTVNVSGCLLIGVLMALVTHRWPDRRLIRPFLGVGLLGGYTTFSTSVVDVQQAVAHGAPLIALGYLGATVGGALLAVWLGAAVTESALGARR
ncbi:fluoride efflux transporter FluC [Jidongwangia harbinensis]|uniref:fluoride efflux transporter FluC n=1 Tax=Jidongwangia harbinensis TaxID=2878561 RepID=UPI001CDA461D|nr:CrcB family protein [Jidongwangia harbinensis]MCA2214429.1 CrcB family protein [Jidongwangia harbinensis]